MKEQQTKFCNVCSKGILTRINNGNYDIYYFCDNCGYQKLISYNQLLEDQYWDEH